MEPYKIIEYRGYEIKIYPELEPSDPREWCNLGRMICFHPRYDLGDDHAIDKDMFSSWAEIENYLKSERKAFIFAPLFLYDHSGLHLYYGGYNGPNARWDSMQVGYIYATEDQIKQNFGEENITDDIKKRAERALKAEVATYDKYLSGHVQRYVIEHEETGFVDSCGGFYDPERMLEEAESVVDYQIKARHKAHAEKVKAWIRNRVPLQYRT